MDVHFSPNVSLNILRGHRIYCISFNFVQANSAEPDSIFHFVAFQLSLPYLLKYPFRGFQSTNG